MMKRYSLIFYIAISWFLLFAFQLKAQENKFFHYGLEEGLSQESVQTIIEDSDGFLWLGTQDGLNRFDGNAFTVYKNNSKDSLSISGNFVKKLLQNINGTIWIGTANNGVCYYIPELNSFKKVDSKKGNCTSLSKDKNGNVYASFLDNGLSVFNLKNGSYTASENTFFSSKNLKLTTTLIHENHLYVGTKDGRLFSSIINNDKLSFKEIILNNKLNSINTLYFNADLIWLGTDLGLHVYNTKTQEQEEITIEQFNPHLSEKPVIETIKFFKNNFYVATDNGLFILSDFNKDTYQFQNCTLYKGDKNKTSSITSNRVYDLLIEEHQLWIGTNKLDQVSLEKPVFNIINTNSEIALNNNHVFSILKNNAYTFVGTRDGLNCINNITNEVTIISKENTNNKLAYNVIRGIKIDNNNNLWLATTKGVSVIDLTDFNPKQPKIKSIYHKEKDSQSLSNNKTRSIYLDTNNNIWITTYGGGINRFTGDLNSNTFTFKRYFNQPSANSISSDFTFSITQDKQKNYWVTSENGLNKITFETNYTNPNFTAFYHDKDNPNSLNSSTTLCSFHDADGTFWIGTQDGLHKYIEAENTFIFYGKEQGLTNTFVYSILEDNLNNLWLTTNEGIFKFDKKTEIFTNYTTKDGVQSSEFNLGAYYDDNGILYFGGINGYNYFNPEDTYKLDKEGKLVFTSLKIKDQVINPFQKNAILNKSISKTKSITLSHLDFPCYLTFSDLDLRQNKNNQFVYKLLPNNKDWNDLHDTKEIQLLDLQKGRYTLQLQGKTRNTLWTKPPLEIELIVTPPWYKSNFAYITFLLLGLSLFYLFYKFQIQRKLAHQEASRLRDLNDLKNKLFTNITHEFRTPITVILGMVDSLKRNEKEKENIPLEMIERNGHNLLSLVNQMLDLAKLERGKLNLKLEQNNIVSHVRYITNSFMSYAQEEKIALVFYNEEDQIIMDYDAEKIKQIVTNLISNAVKFCSENDEIVAHTSTENSQFILKVKDTGKGIPKDKLPFIFDRFYQVENSMNDSDGSGIGLAFTKELVNLMKGKITVDSTVNKGTTFTITLPITNDATLEESNRVKIAPKSTAKSVIFNANPNIELPIALIVEDNKDIASYINLCIQDKYQTMHALNGKIGIEMAMEHTPDIIVSDVMMPEKNGFELCETLKQDIKTSHIPIILLTAKATQSDKISGISLGADAYLTKPFDKVELLTRIKQLITLRQKLQKKYKTTKSWLDTSTKKSNTQHDDFINQAIQAINKNLDNASFNAFYLARAVHLSESQLYRKLKALTNTSTAIFIRKVRLEHAKKQLQTTKITVSEVAYATGFNDPSWFSKAFKEEFGFSPSDIRN